METSWNSRWKKIFPVGIKIEPCGKKLIQVEKIFPVGIKIFPGGKKLFHVEKNFPWRKKFFLPGMVFYNIRFITNYWKIIK